MNFDPFEFYGNYDNFDDNFNYYNNNPDNFYSIAPTFIFWIVGLIAAAIILGFVLNITFLSKKNEGRFKGFWGKVYNFFSLNRFYSEDIIKLFSVIAFLMITFLSIYTICTGEVFVGILTLIFGNLGARVLFELLMMFVIFCRKSVSIDKKLTSVEKYYSFMDEVESEVIKVDEEVEEETAVEEELSPKEDAKEEEIKEKLEGIFGKADAPKYGYDEECKSCDNWSEEEQDCYCPDDCLTCDKPDADNVPGEEASEEAPEEETQEEPSPEEAPEEVPEEAVQEDLKPEE